MAKPSNRDSILCKGFQVFVERGYMGASVREIAASAGVSLGTFTGHFASKEAFALEAMNVFYRSVTENFVKILKEEDTPGLKRIKNFLDATDGEGIECSGCTLNNFSAEASKHSEAIRNRLLEINAELEDAMVSALKAAVKSADLPKTSDCKALAGFIMASMQGAALQAKVENSDLPIKRFKKLLFSNVLR